ncbi:MAG: NAD(P)-dependent oxidoreductase [Bryobacteraceae bacterium]|nr:NAD(P)-dependent oxidoreductase [Bryobacteraceae bacterium]
MRILVTGARGFVGSHLLPHLLSAGHEAAGLDIEHGDLARSMPEAGPADAVIHLAGRSSVMESWQNPAAFYEANVLGTVQVLEYCRRTGARMILVSSYVYGRPRYLPVDEDHALEAFNPYGHSKILAEEAARYYAAAFGVPLAVVRPFNLYGPGQREDFLIPTLIRQVLDPARQRVEVMDTRPRRDFLYVADFADLLERLAASQRQGVYNAGSGASTGIGELVRLLCELAGTDKPLADAGRPRPDEVLDMYASVEKARRELGWEPRTPLREGLALTLAAWKR